MSEINKLITEQKKINEETEFYPTTKEIVQCIADFLNKKKLYVHSVLDIGCGNGCFFEKLDEIKNEKLQKDYFLMTDYKKFGIEKSDILVKNLKEDIILLGSDFYQQTLIDKKIDLIFSNPPYSNYEDWTEKIIRESYAKYIFLIIPERWKNNKKINKIIEKRNYESTIIGKFNFENAERKARAKVDVLFIHSKPYINYYKNKVYEENDPFEFWFNETFKFNENLNTKNNSEYFETAKKTEIIKRTLLLEGDTAENLVKLYNEDMTKLYDNYKALEKLDPILFSELKINIKMLKESLKEKLKCLKYIYWNELFNKYNKIKKRLTNNEINKMMSILNENRNIDFNLDNIFKITLWVIKNSNKKFDEQLKEFFFELCNTESIQRYKSNKRWNEDEWLFIKKNIINTYRGYVDKDKIKKLTNIKLDYRIVLIDYSNFEYDYKGNVKSFSQNACNFLHDMKVIANNLGFKLELDEYYSTYCSNNNFDESEWKNKNIYTTKGELFCNIKFYKNGNRHIKFNPDFMKALNLEMARINKWILNKKEAAEELELSEKEIQKFWNNNIYYKLEQSSIILGLPANMA